MAQDPILIIEAPTLRLQGSGHIGFQCFKRFRFQSFGLSRIYGFCQTVAFVGLTGFQLELVVVEKGDL